MYDYDYTNNFKKELKVFLKNSKEYKKEISNFISLIIENPYRIDIDREKLQGVREKITTLTNRYRKGKIRIIATIYRNKNYIIFKKIGERNDFYN